MNPNSDFLGTQPKTPLQTTLKTLFFLPGKYNTKHSFRDRGLCVRSRDDEVEVYKFSKKNSETG